MADNKEQKDSEDKNNFDWNKKSFESSERLTLKINVHEAMRYQAEKSKKQAEKLPKNMNKLRKKVRDSYDEEDEDGVDEDVLRALRELQMNMEAASNGDNSLLNALMPNERRMINQQATIDSSRHQLNAGIMTAMMQADSLSQKAGLNKLNIKDYANQIQTAIYNPRQIRNRSLEKNIEDRLGIKGKIKKHNVGKVVEGVKKIKETSGNRKVKGINMDDAQKVGKKNMSQNATAELILKKSGQTARLSEIKRNATDKNFAQENTNSYAQQMKELLRESLKKNDKVH